MWLFLSALLLFIGTLTLSFTEINPAFIYLANALNIVFLMLFSFLFIYKNELLNSIYTQSQTNEYVIESQYEPLIGKGLSLFFISFSLPLLYLAFTNTFMYRSLINEDKIVEYASAGFWVLASIFTLVKIIKNQFQNIYLRQLALPVLMVAFFIVCAGEEISWGQRIFNIETPTLLKEINVQEEITLHNIGSISVFSNTFFIITLFFFFFIPLYAKKNIELRNLCLHLNLIIPSRFSTIIFSLSLIVWVAVGIRFGTLGFHPYSFYETQYYNQMDDEIFELFAAYSFFTYSLISLFVVVKPSNNKLSIKAGT